jgi:hypothetical protein
VVARKRETLTQLVVSGTNDDYVDVRVYAAHWDGSDWDLFATPISGDNAPHSFAAVAVSTTDVWLTADVDYGLSPERAVAAYWNGRAWVDASPARCGNCALTGVSAGGAGVWAVGWSLDGNRQVVYEERDGVRRRAARV